MQRAAATQGLRTIRDADILAPLAAAMTAVGIPVPADLEAQLQDTQLAAVSRRLLTEVVFVPPLQLAVHFR